MFPPAARKASLSRCRVASHHRQSRGGPRAIQFPVLLTNPSSTRGCSSSSSNNNVCSFTPPSVKRRTDSQTSGFVAGSYRGHEAPGFSCHVPLSSRAPPFTACRRCFNYPRATELHAVDISGQNCLTKKTDERRVSGVRTANGTELTALLTQTPRNAKASNDCTFIRWRRRAATQSATNSRLLKIYRDKRTFRLMRVVLQSKLNHYKGRREASHNGKIQEVGKALQQSRSSRIQGLRKM